MGCGGTHTTFDLFIPEEHFNSNNLGIFLAGRDMQIFNHFPHRADFVGQGRCRDFDLIELELLKLFVARKLLSLLSLPVLLESWLSDMEIGRV